MLDKPTLGRKLVDLMTQRCKPCEGGTAPLTPQEIADRLAVIHGWQVTAGQLTKTYAFKNYYETMAFVNATAWISHQENHHPDLEVSYNRCVVRYSTHAIGGLSENDFICAAKVDALTTPPAA